MIVIADTSPLNYFILLSHVEALRNLYGRVIIPQAVADELNSPKSPKPVREWVRSLPAGLKCDKLRCLLIRGWQSSMKESVRQFYSQKSCGPTP